jgi:NFU1 iron-sulfur cluster scaffold homolog, mitochondrial
MDNNKFPTTVYAEMTPNPSTMKFVVDRKLVAGLHQLDFKNVNEAKVCSPLAAELFNFPFVIGVFISGEIVSVTKDESLGWEMIVMQLREYIREWLVENEFAVEEDKISKLSELSYSMNQELKSPESIEQLIESKNISPTEYDKQIGDLLNEFVRPAVEQDGGAIDFVGFNDGIVYVQLRGACAGCPSSTETLKGGIETLLTSKIEEITEVVAIS